MTTPKPTPRPDSIEAMTDDLTAVFGPEHLRRALDKAAAAKKEAAEERAAFASDPDYRDSLRGTLSTCAAVLLFIQAGNATLTIVSRKSSARYTFKFVRPRPKPGERRPTWVRWLTGPDNETDYNFLGTLWEGPNGLAYVHSRKSKMPEDATCVKVLTWLVKCLNTGNDTKLAQSEIWHEGRCGRCGRKLTVPSSIASGFGPECINHV
jgi:hypothetical protein